MSAVGTEPIGAGTALRRQLMGRSRGPIFSLRLRVHAVAGFVMNALLVRRASPLIPSHPCLPVVACSVCSKAGAVLSTQWCLGRRRRLVPDVREDPLDHRPPRDGRDDLQLAWNLPVAGDRSWPALPVR